MAHKRIRILDKPKPRIRIMDEHKPWIDPQELARRLGGKLCDPPPQFAQLAAPYLSPVLCEHANENPGMCRCPENCACREHMCRNRPLPDGEEMLIKYGPRMPDPDAFAERLAEAVEACEIPQAHDDDRDEAWDDLVRVRGLDPSDEAEFRQWCLEHGMELEWPDRRHLDAEYLLWLLTRKATPFDYLVLAAGKAYAWLKGLWR